MNLPEENRVQNEQDVTRSKRNKRRREKYNSLTTEQRNEHNKQRRIHYNTWTHEQSTGRTKRDNLNVEKIVVDGQQKNIGEFFILSNIIVIL